MWPVSKFVEIITSPPPRPRVNQYALAPYNTPSHSLRLDSAILFKCQSQFKEEKTNAVKFHKQLYVTDSDQWQTPSRENIITGPYRGNQRRQKQTNVHSQVWTIIGRQHFSWKNIWRSLFVSTYPGPDLRLASERLLKPGFPNICISHRCCLFITTPFSLSPGNAAKASGNMSFKPRP